MTRSCSSCRCLHCCFRLVLSQSWWRTKEINVLSSTAVARVAQTLGLVQGLPEVVEGQQSAFKEQEMTQIEVTQKTNSQLGSLTEMV